MWIKRDISFILNSSTDRVQILVGPRQCGKTALFHHLGRDHDFVSLDDFHERDLARRDPVLFFDRFRRPLIVDEAWYAPELFPEIKRRVDLAKRAGTTGLMYRLTGSNQVMMDREVRESLAGRASYYNLNTLSVSELMGMGPNPPDVTTILFRGGWPELHSAASSLDPIVYLNDYIRTYVEKDVSLTIGIRKLEEYNRFLRILAARTGTVLNHSDISRDLGVEVGTVKEWISILERMEILILLEPYFTNLSKRLVKSPKLYFFDTGLAVRLQGWTEAAPLVTSPQGGALFETLVCGEIRRYIQNRRLPWRMHYWRTRDGKELDFVLELSPKRWIFLECKLTAPQLEAVTGVMHESGFVKTFGKENVVATVTFSGQLMETARGHWRVPVASLAEYLDRFNPAD